MVHYRFIIFFITLLSFSTSLLSCNAFDPANETGDNVDPDTLVSSGNNLPTALIESITPGSASEGDTVTFTGSGSDTDGSIAAYRWSSSLDGNLSAGASFSNTTLSVGSHVITFEVQDNDGDWSDPVTQGVTIQAIGAIVPPTALIESITPNSAREGDSVIFTGSGSDTDGSIATYQWSSSLDGNLSASASFSSTTLSVGTHTISFKVQNDKGVWSAADVVELDVNMTSAEVFPGERWNTATPESQGVDSAVLQQAIDYFGASSGGVGVDEMVVVRNGYVVWQGTNIDNQHEIFSGSKTFTTTILGLLLQDGLISALESKAVDYLPVTDDSYVRYGDITFRQLATMTSGYDGINGDCWQMYTQGAYDEHDACVRTYTVPGMPLSDAGTTFRYHDPAVHLLGRMMVHIAGRSLEDIFKERVANEIGMKTFTWTDYGMIDGLDGIIFNNPAGTPGIDQGGVITTAEDAARYGLLYLKRGNWNGRQLLRREWVDQATSNQVPNSLETVTSHRGRFGYMWHTNDVSLDGERRWPSAPPKTYTFIGFSRNYCFVILNGTW